MKNILAIILLLAAGLSLFAEDDLVAVDAAAGMITVQQRGALKTYRLKPFTDITINGQKATAGQLKAGMQVSLGLADPQTASKVTARGNVQPVATPSPGSGPGTPAPFFANRPSGNLSRKIVFKGLIDAGDNLIIQDGKLSIQHIDWSKPKDISVNGIKWVPEWNDNKSDNFTGFTPPLAPFQGSTVSVKKVKTKGDVTVLEPPTEANGNKLVIHLQDKWSGASEFEVHVTW